MNKNKILATVLTVSLIGSNIAASGIQVYAATPFEKEEVVYIMTDANGSVNSVNVVNIFGKGEVTDYGNYSSVKMLTSTAPIQQDGDTVTFSTNQDKVYYQGTMENTQIPWNIRITYTLNGKETAPDQLSGQSGALEIHINITENEKCKNDYYSNYALQATFTLDTELCKNIRADEATLANVGFNKQISYTILPGKGLDATISADVMDFEMDAVTINGIKLNLNIEIDDEELMNKVTEIMDATKELNDAASVLADGSAELSDAGGDLNHGVDSLYAATSTLDNGINSLTQGVTAMQNGLDTLNSKSSALTTGSVQIKEALTTIQSELNKVSVSTEQLKQLTDSSSTIKQGIGDLYTGAVTLQNSLSYESYKAAMNENGLNIDVLKESNSAALSALSQQITGLQSSLEQIKAIPGYSADENYVNQVAQLETQIASLTEVITLLTGNNAAIGGTEAYFNRISSGVNSLVTGLSDLKDNYETFDAAIATLTDTLSGLAINMGSLKSGIDQLVTNYATLDSGINEYTNGVAAIVASYQTLAGGVGALASGSRELLEGTGTLKEGTSDLYDGILSLCDGTGQLSDGTSDFYEKTSDMDAQMEDTIDDMISSISGEETEPLSFASNKNKNVKAVQFVIKTSSIEKAEIAATEEKTTQKTSFRQKLLQLFGL